MEEIKSYKVSKLPLKLTPNSIYWVKSTLDTQISGFITDINGVPYSIKDISGSGIQTIINTDNNLQIIGATGLVINISPALLEIINSAIQPDNVNTIERISGESIPSYTPVAIYNNLAYKLDASNPSHQFAFVGFSKNGTISGQNCIIQQTGEMTLAGWGLIPNKQYLASTNGTMVLNNTVPANFTKVIGYATTSNTLQIIKDYTTINT